MPDLSFACYISHPGLPTDELLLTLVRADLEDEPIYDALSYTWGDHEDLKKVTCNGINIAVSRNLIAALLRLRTEEKTQVVWADPICINQQNLAERGSQVK